MKRKSFLVILIICFWVGYTLLSVFQTIYSTLQNTAKINSIKNSNIDFILESSQLYITSENFDVLQEQLNKAATLKFIDYFCFKKSNEVIFEHYPKANASACELMDKNQFKTDDAFYQFSNRVIRPLKMDNYLLLVGYNNNLSAFIVFEHKEHLMSFLKDIFIITTFLGFLIYLVLKDFLQLDRLLQSGNKQGLSKIKARSKEAQTLIDSTFTLNRLNTEQTDKIHHLQNTVGLAVHSEIDKKTPHLTHIPSAVVRIDLNGYTQIFLEKKEEHIVSVLNEYFSVTNDLISRFHGQIYQIIGDEIIFVLKNQDPTLALFCVRAIFEWAHELDKKIYSEHKHRFLLKASVSFGSLRFIQLNNGYAFAGVPLIESVRLLGCVSDKSENTLIVKKEDAQKAIAFFRNPTSKFVDLKGFEEKSEILEIKDFLTLKEFFETSMGEQDPAVQRQTMQMLTFFRGLADVSSALTMLNQSLTAQKYLDAFFLIQHLKEMKLGVSHPQIANQLYQILSDHFPIITGKSKDYPFLNSVVMMVNALVHPDLWSTPWTNLIKNYLLCSDARVVANATEVLCKYGFDFKELQAVLVNWKDNNRISANFVLFEMRRKIKKQNVKTLIGWLESSHVLFQASALYVIEETLRFYLRHDPIVYKTSELLADCIVAANQLKSSTNPVIKARVEKLQILLTSHKDTGSEAA